MITICFDIDGCLIWSEGMGEEPDSPRYEIINLLKTFDKLFKCEIFIWSGGGIEYSRRWKEKLGLNYPVITKGSFTPDIAVDDEEVNLGKVNLKV